MTNAQKWVLIVFFVFIALLVIGRVSKNSKSDSMLGYESMNSQETEQLDGMSLITKIGCTSCHGNDLKGSTMAPSLYEAKNYWSRDKLINYLRNPSSYSGDARFDAYREKYRALMPSYNNIDVKQLGIISDYILNLKDE